MLLVTRNFPPLWGGMERLLFHAAEELARAGPVALVAPAGAAGLAPQDIDVSEVPLSPLWHFLIAATAAAVRQARRLRPRVVLAGSGLLAPVALAAARRSGARAAVYLHGLDIAASHPLYRALWIPAIRRLDVVVANSRATAGIARSRGVAADRIRLVHPGVELPPDDPEARARFRRRHGLGERPLLLYAGRLTRRKGLLELVREVLPLVLRKRPDAVLLVAGDTPQASLHPGKIGRNEVLEAARAAEVPREAIRFLGVLQGSALDKAYFAADVHVFPVRDLPDDPEGFGMVALEAAAHGLPTVAYAVGGVPDAVADGVTGRLVRPGDAHAFARAALELLASPPPPEGMRDFARRFSWRHFGDGLARALGLSRDGS